MAPILEFTLKSVVLILIALTGFAYTTLLERKFIGRLQARVGPNRAGPQGLLQPVADGLKLIVKESITPAQADKLIYFLAPALAVVPALIVFAVIPFGKGPWLNLAGDINIGVLYVLAVLSVGVYGSVLAGWASNNKYASLGGLRATAQMISYELALGLSIVAVVLMSSNASLNGIVDYQQPGNILGWLIFRQPVAAVIFVITALAELARAPFDLVEAEQELTAGFLTEYGGMKFALFYMSEYVKMIAMSALFATFFLGGWSGPGVNEPGVVGPVLSVVYFAIKVFLCLLGIVWVRATLPRFRYDKLMSFGWKALLPISLANIVVTALLIVLGVPGYK
ncbi:MAG: NADH-quinone oxidoreductase subunit NuoH [Chloroflexi bacterium]|nr:NADH-quinone oxidoreductase subunit NuoH [Chloroflexota bacterium]MCL5274326.1 NADH-quinone oxidoreductase subunit NuoH [Chloroflexota bacterium]